MTTSSALEKARRREIGGGAVTGPSPQGQPAVALVHRNTVCLPMISVELRPVAPHYNHPSESDRKAMAESPHVAGTSLGMRKNVHQSQVAGGTLHVQARCMNSLARVPHARNFFHLVSRPYATLAQVLHGVKKPQRSRRRSITPLANGAARADR